MQNPSFEFSRAITRRPSASVADGLRAVDVGAPSLEGMLVAHSQYVAALKSTGAEVIELEPLEAFPDAVFVEDTALCLPQGAVLMRPGAPSRMGEVAEMAPTLRHCYPDLQEITGPGHIEGGDILVTGREILVGRSDRTDAAGVAELTGIVAGWGTPCARFLHRPVFCTSRPIVPCWMEIRSCLPGVCPLLAVFQATAFWMSQKVKRPRPMPSVSTIW